MLTGLLWPLILLTAYTILVWYLWRETTAEVLPVATARHEEYAEDQRTTTASANPSKSASPVTSVAPKRRAVA